MKISLSFEELSSMLGYCNIILGDKSVDDKQKNIIFMVKEDGVRVIAYSPYTFVRCSFEKEPEVSLDGKSEWVFQVKAAELNRIVTAFSSLYKTKVNSVDFEPDGVRIKMVVHEEAKEEADASFAQDSVFKFETSPIMEKALVEISTEFPEEVDMLSSGELQFFLDALYPLLSSDGIGSKINFAKDYAFVVNGAMSAFIENKLPDSFKGLSIPYSSVGFLKRVTEKSEMVGVAKKGRYLCVQEGNLEAFIMFQPVKVKYDMYLKKRSNDKGFVVDRLYLKDVLRRMGNLGVDGKMYVQDDGSLYVCNDNFNQVIPLNKVRDAYGIQFSTAVQVLEKSILGKDDVLGSELFMYFVDTQRGYVLYVSDKTGAWFTNTQVTKI